MADRVLVGKEYAAVLHECRDAYFKQRRALLLDPVRDRIQTAASQGQNDLGAIARQGCALLCDVCHREYKLQQRRISAAPRLPRPLIRMGYSICKG